jgi:two-component sensor histidine kinase
MHQKKYCILEKKAPHMPRILSFLALLVFSFPLLAQDTTKRQRFDHLIKLSHTESNQEKALQSALEALQIANALNNDTLIPTALLCSSINYINLGNLNQALAQALKAYPYFEGMFDNYGYYALNSRIGNIYACLKNYPLAMTYHKKAISNNPKYYFVDLSGNLNIGEQFRHMQTYDSALFYYARAEAIAIKYNYPAYDAFILANKGLAYAAQQNTSLSDSLLQQAFKLFIESEEITALAETYIDLARIKSKQEALTEAMRWAQKAYNLADSSQLAVEKKDASRLLSMLYEQQKNYTQAYFYLKSFNTLRDKISNDSVISTMAEMRAEHEISKKEEEVNYFKKLSKVRTSLALISSFGVVIVLILLAFLIAVNKKRRQANLLLSEYNEELQQKNHIIHQALLDKETLIKEIHHRVKNNLQIISSIINLQSMRIENAELNEIFNEMQRRIMAISSIHHKLYQGDSVSLISMNEYLTEVVDAIHTAFNNADLEVGFQIAIQNIKLDIDAAVSIGLMVNELCTNAYKYAFKDAHNKNHLFVGLTTTDNKFYELTVSDNGTGLPKDFSIDKSNSLGLRMVSLLTRQLHGTVNFASNQGASFSIRFKPDKKNK